MTDEGPHRPHEEDRKGLRPRWVKTLYRLSPFGLRRGIDRLQEAFDELADHSREGDRRLAEIDARLNGIDDRLDSVEHRLDEVADRLETRLDATEETIRDIQSELGSLRDERTPKIERRLDDAEGLVAGVQAEAARLRDRVVPAAVERGNVLIDRLAEEIEEVGSLVERMLLSEPLPVPAPDYEQRLPAALAEIQPLLLEQFRGSEVEIRHRLEHHLVKLEAAGPVLDLGCGRGELLLLLREAGVEACGIESDPALAQAARRRGIEVIEADALEELRSHSAERWGALTAIHLLEHLDSGDTLQLLAEARRVLRPGGLLLAESPNPHCLRVGAALYWRDPTHRRPLLPETLALYLETSGFEVRGVEYLHPFPDEQRLALVPGDPPGDTPPELVRLNERIDRLASSLDELLNGPRDFAIVAAKPTS
jgi:SAM-dependent methyltransferase